MLVEISAQADYYQAARGAGCCPHGAQRFDEDPSLRLVVAERESLLELIDNYGHAVTRYVTHRYCPVDQVRCVFWTLGERCGHAFRRSSDSRRKLANQCGERVCCRR